MAKKKTSRISSFLGNGNLAPSFREINAITLSGSGIASIIGIIIISASLFIVGAFCESRICISISLAAVFIPLISFQIKKKFVFGNFYSILYKDNHPLAYKVTLIIQVIVWFVATWAIFSIANDN